MKKAHIAPVVRKVEFAYNEQVVASGGPIYVSCTITYSGLDGAPGTACQILGMVNNQK